MIRLREGEMTELKLEDLSRLSVKNGDIVVVRLPVEPSAENVDRVRDAVKKILSRQGFHGVEVLVTGPGVEISVLSNDVGEKSAA
jgi:hypothetical protein